MALNKRIYTSNETVITAENLNDIQDEIINGCVSREEKSFTGAEKAAARETISSAFGGHNIVCFGDSWSYGTGLSNPDSECFPARLASKLGLNLFNYAISGGGHKVPDELKYMSRQLDIVTDGNTITAQGKAGSTRTTRAMTEDERLDTKYVIALEGINDYHYKSQTGLTLSQWQNLWKSWLTRCRGLFPNAKIVCLPINSHNTYYSDTTGLVLRNWYDSLKPVVYKHTVDNVLIDTNGINVLTGQKQYYVDESGTFLHPTADGAAMLAGYVANLILGGDTSIDRYIGRVTYTSGVLNTSKTWTPIYFFRHDYDIRVTSSLFYLTSTIAANTSVELGTAPEEVYIGMKNSLPIKIPVFISSATVANNKINGHIVIDKNGKVTLYASAGITVAAGYTDSVSYPYVQ